MSDDNKIIPGIAPPSGQIREKETPHLPFLLPTSSDICASSVSRETSCRLIPVLCYPAAHCSGPIRAFCHDRLQRANQRLPSLLVAFTLCSLLHWAFSWVPGKFLFSAPENSCGLQTQLSFCCLSAWHSDWLITIKTATVLPAVCQRNAHVFPLAE